MPKTDAIQRTLDEFPKSAGVYLMKDRGGEILYVGKAKDLRARVRSYFLAGARHSPKTEVLLSKVAQIDFMVTESEVEAYILESNLIKKNRPRYNVMLRDDKHYPYLRLTMQEDFPRLEVVRKIRKDGARYFGPYVPGSNLRATLELIERTFPLRKSRRKIEGTDNRPCLNHQIGRCLAPCAGKISKADYARIVREVILFLKGKNKELLRALNAKMVAASEAREYERAATIRDQIRRIETVTAQQKIISASLEDKDIFGTALGESSSAVEILFVRGGKLLGKKDFFFDRHHGESAAELLRNTLIQYYGSDRLIPPRLYLSEALPDGKTLEEALSTLAGRRVQLRVPQRGVNRKLCRMASENAALALKAHRERESRERLVLAELQRAAGLKNLPQCIEAFDISNIQGELPVGSMVVFENGRPRKSRYRHYRIRSVSGANDYAMMEEVLMRRYRDEVDTAGPTVPDLVLMDGGKGQLHVLMDVARRRRLLQGADLAALAKARPGGTVVQERERIYLPGRREPILLDPADPVCHLLQRIRDEAHRFAVAYYRKLHSRESLSTRLQGVRGVGRKRSLSLLRHFGSLQRVREASLEELMAAPSMNRQVAARVYDTLRNERGPTT